MKLIVQIPCYNEEQTLPLVLESIPKKIPGIDTIETLIVDDGSSDHTVAIARQLGVNHIIQHRRNQGLAISFADGINASIKLGADIIVNTDADNQYPQQDIPKLIAPILNGSADMVVGDRQTNKIAHFSPLKKKLQWFGSFVVRKLSGTNIPDAVSGFRAYTREAAMQLNIVTDFSYVIETLIQAQYKRMAVASIPVTTNPPTRKSRLFKSMRQHIQKSTAAILRSYTMYRPLSVFMFVGVTLIYAGVIFIARFLFFSFLGQGSGHVQSLILAGVLVMAGFQVAMTGIVADLIATNRKLLEDNLRRVKRLQNNEDEKPYGTYVRMTDDEEQSERQNRNRIYA